MGDKDKGRAVLKREYEVRGVMVEFPFEPYEAQLAFMDKMVEALQSGSNALLESPTGTGKTLCLLVASLAWRQMHAACVQAHRSGLSMTEAGSNMQRELLNGASGGIPIPAPVQPGQLEKMCQRIVYTSRTHGQLAQVIKELRCTAYKPRCALLGSRQQLCIHKGDDKHYPLHSISFHADETMSAYSRIRFFCSSEKLLSLTDGQ